MPVPLPDYMVRTRYCHMDVLPIHALTSVCEVTAPYFCSYIFIFMKLRMKTIGGQC